VGQFSKMNEELKEHYKQRDEWHKRNVALVAEFFKRTCQFCNRKTNLKNGAIHHLKYTGNDYKKSFEKLLEDKAITWICKECHKFEHIAYTIEEINYKMKHSGYCAVCNSFSWHGWYKRGFGRIAGLRHDSFPLCDACLEVLIECNVLKREAKNINGTDYDIIYFDNFLNLSDKAKYLCKEISKKIKANVFGDRALKVNWQNKHGDQLGLF